MTAGTLRAGPWLRRIAIVCGVAYGLLAVVGVVPAAMSFMLFDAPGSDTSPATIALFCGIVSGPVVLLGSALALGIAFIRGLRGLLIIAVAAPFALLVYVAVVAVVLQVRCGGSLVCP